MHKKIWLSSPHMGSAEQSFIQAAFDTNWIAPLGPNVDGFESDLAAFTKVPYAAALSSGTAALHMALIILGVQKDDVVLCQSFTFSATANPIVYCGATPVFIDSEADSWNMDTGLLELAIKEYIGKNKKPKAIIPVHLYGMPANMDAIMKLAHDYEIPVIEDAAEALGSMQNGKACGSFGDMGVLSFNGNKIITTSSGGALLSANESWIKQSRFLSTQARDAAPHYQHSQVGYNYRMSNVLAGIGRGQMEVLDERIKQRRNNFEVYRNAFGKIDGIDFQNENENNFSNRWLTALTIDPKKTNGITRENIRIALEKENIETRPLWKPMHVQPVFAGAPFYANNVSEQLFEQGLCLPSGSNLTEEDLGRVINAIQQIIQ